MSTTSVPITETTIEDVNGGPLVTLHAKHTCGHVIGYSYIGRSFAENDKDRMCAKDCLDCVSNKRILKQRVN
jgi:hypothetical protein